MRLLIIFIFVFSWGLTSFSQIIYFRLDRDILFPINRVDSVIVNGERLPNFNGFKSSFVPIPDLKPGSVVTFYCENVYRAQFFLKKVISDTIHVTVECTLSSLVLEISDLTAVEDIKNNNFILYTPSPYLVKNEKIVNDIIGGGINVSLRFKGGHSYMTLEGIKRYNNYVLGILHLEEPVLEKLRKYLLFNYSSI